MAREYAREHRAKAEAFQLARRLSQALKPVIRPGCPRIPRRRQMEEHIASLWECDRLRRELDDLEAEWSRASRCRDRAA